MMNKKSMEIEYGFLSQMIENAVLTKLYERRGFKQWFGGIEAGTQEEIEKELMDVIVEILKESFSDE